jgi:hypothetical protein
LQTAGLLAANRVAASAGVCPNRQQRPLGVIFQFDCDLVSSARLLVACRSPGVSVR